MKREMLLGLLANYNPSTTDEQLFKQKMISFVREHSNCFERTLEAGHITASCWLINKDGSQALLMHHAKLNRWLQLGGHCDGDSDVLNVALKEAQEESGISNIVPVDGHIFDIDIHLIPENSKEKAHYHYDVRFLLQVAGDQDFVKNSESRDLQWISKDRAVLTTDNPSIVRMFHKWADGGVE